MDKNTRVPRGIKESRAVRKNLLANTRCAIVSKKTGVDFKPDELSLARKPIRPVKWKPKRKFTGKMDLKLQWLDKSVSASYFKVTLSRAHRPYKASMTHFETMREFKKLEKSVNFSDIPGGDYTIVFQPKGFRPFISFVQFTRRNHTFDLTIPLLPVSSPEEEQDLLRFGERHPYIINVRGFLKRFGYLKRDTCNCPDDELCAHMHSALYVFQKTYKLSARGTITVDTFLLMQKPRCAHPDLPVEAPHESSAGPTGITDQDPIVFLGNRWDTFNLLYDLQTGTGDISNEWSIIRAAMNAWANVSPLTFTETNDSTQSHLEFDFRRSSESSYPFDGGGSKERNVLAHAWGPLNGTVEFDDHEDWGSTHLDAVATHEIGHALGLDHSSVNNATMFAWYDSSQASLHEVDVRGIKSLYAPVYYHSGPFVVYPLYAFQSHKGTDSVTIDLGQIKHFLAWGTVTMIDSLVDMDRDNMSVIDIFEVDGNRTNWRVSGGDHWGSADSPGNVYEGAYVGYGRRITFRISSGHTSDLEVSGFAIVLVLD